MPLKLHPKYYKNGISLYYDFKLSIAFHHYLVRDFGAVHLEEKIFVNGGKKKFTYPPPPP